MKVVSRRWEGKASLGWVPPGGYWWDEGQVSPPNTGWSSVGIMRGLKAGGCNGWWGEQAGFTMRALFGDDKVKWLKTKEPIGVHRTGIGVVAKKPKPCSKPTWQPHLLLFANPTKILMMLVERALRFLLGATEENQTAFSKEKGYIHASYELDVSTL